MWWLVFLLASCSSKAIKDQAENDADVGTSVNGKTFVENDDVNASKGAIAPSNNKHNHEEPPKWLMLATAGPTILIFVVCVIVIAIKNYVADRSAEDPQEESGLFKASYSMDEKDGGRKAKKTKVNEDIYNTMLERFKEDKSKKSTFTAGRKSSQIKLEGVHSHSPKNIARKHLILGRLNDNPELESSPASVNKLIEMSSRAMIGNSMFRMVHGESIDKDASTHIRNMIERSKEDLSSCIEILPNDVKSLLPEDLEEAFRNFASWQESLL